MGQAQAKQASKNTGNAVTATHGHALLGNFDGCVINLAAAAQTGLIRDFAPNVVKLVQTYVPRPDLTKQLETQLHARIEHGDTEHQWVIVHGFGGVGKSQLVLDYVQRHRSDYSATICISAVSQASIERDFMQMYRLIYDKRTEKETDLPKIEDVIFAVKTWFEQQDRHWLFVFDSADTICEEDAEVNLRIQDYMLRLPKSHTIVTTRASLARRMSTNASIHVGDMEVSEAMQLFSKCAELKDDNQQSDVRLIVEEVGYHALAVTLAGYYVSKIPDVAQDLSIYLQEYRCQRKRLLGVKPQNYHQYNESVAATLEISFRSIGHRSAISLRLLGLLSCLNPDDIFTGLFLDSAGVDTISKEWQDVLFAKESVDASSLRESISLLEDYSLVKRRVDQASYVMHQIVHAWAFERLGNPQQLEYARAAAELLAGLPSRPQLSLTTKYRMIPHIIANHEALNKAFMVIDPHEKTTPSQALEIYVETAHFLLDMGQYSSAIESFKACSQWCEKLLVAGTHLIVISKEHLVTTLMLVGNVDETTKLMKQIIDILDLTAGPLYAHTLLVRGTLADLLCFGGKHSEAEAMCRQVIATMQQTPELPAHHIVHVLTILKLSLAKQGRTQEAESVQQEILSVKTWIVSQEDIESIEALHYCVETLGDSEEAIETKRRILKMMQQSLGPEDPETIWMMQHMADTLLIQGNKSESTSMRKEIVELRQSTQGPEHPHTIYAMVYLVEALLEQGNFDEALILNRKALELSKRILGPDHRFTVCARLAALIIEMELIYLDLLAQRDALNH